MNLLEVPFHLIQQKIMAKQVCTKDKECALSSFTMSEIISMLGDGLCKYTGKEFLSLKDATFERVNPNVGYVPGNVVMVCQQANSRKSQLDAFVKAQGIGTEMKIKLLRKALYQLEKENGGKKTVSS